MISEFDVITNTQQLDRLNTLWGRAQRGDRSARRDIILWFRQLFPGSGIKRNPNAQKLQTMRDVLADHYRESL